MKTNRRVQKGQKDPCDDQNRPNFAASARHLMIIQSFNYSFIPSSRRHLFIHQLPTPKRPICLPWQPPILPSQAVVEDIKVDPLELLQPETGRDRLHENAKGSVDLGFGTGRGCSGILGVCAASAASAASVSARTGRLVRADGLEHLVRSNQMFVCARCDFEDSVAEIRGRAAAAEDVFFTNIGGGEHVERDGYDALILMVVGAVGAVGGLACIV